MSSVPVENQDQNPFSQPKFFIQMNSDLPSVSSCNQVNACIQTKKSMGTRRRKQGLLLHVATPPLAKPHKNSCWHVC